MGAIKQKHDKISRMFTGLAGIHATGHDDKTNTINIYAEDPASANFKKILPRIEQEAKPHNIEVIKGKPAGLEQI